MPDGSIAEHREAQRGNWKYSQEDFYAGDGLNAPTRGELVATPLHKNTATDTNLGRPINAPASDTWGYDFTHRELA